MRSLDERLKEQNNGRAWLDCEAHGLCHRWAREQRVGDAVYWRCRRCPVSQRRTVQLTRIDEMDEIGGGNYGA